MMVELQEMPPIRQKPEGSFASAQYTTFNSSPLTPFSTGLNPLEFITFLKTSQLPLDHLAGIFRQYLQSRPGNVHLDGGNMILHYFSSDRSIKGAELFEMVLHELVNAKSFHVLHDLNIWGQTPLATAVYAGNNDQAKKLITLAHHCGTSNVLLKAETTTGSNLLHAAAGYVAIPIIVCTIKLPY
jgi:hypothetical protein